MVVFAYKSKLVEGQGGGSYRLAEVEDRHESASLLRDMVARGQRAELINGAHREHMTHTYGMLRELTSHG